MIQIEVAKTLTDILKNPIVATSLDKSKPIDNIVKKIEALWAADLVERRPAPAYREGIDGEPIYKGTNLDLFTVMNALTQRQAVINIPNYKEMCATKIRPDQRVISKQNRHGQVFGVISNADVHSFSSRIKDYNVIQKLENRREEVGAFRNFMLVDPQGRMYDGWSSIEFEATPEEKEFFEEREIYAVPETIRVHKFVTSSLANGFFGSRYIATKVLASRIADEARHYRGMAKVLRTLGITLGGKRRPQKTFTALNGVLEKVQVENLEARLILPEATGEYPLLGIDKKGNIRRYQRMPSSYRGKQDVLRYAENRARELSYHFGPKINTPVRAVELAFYLNGFKHGQREYGNEREPGWGIPEWNREYKITPKSRIEWNALEFRPKTALLYRIRETTRTVKI